MEANKIYMQLEKDFVKPEFTDDWEKSMIGIEDFITDQYKRRYMGLVCDNTKTINKVYTAVFASRKVMQEILDKNERDIMLFVHHPAEWKITGNPSPWILMERELLEKFKENRISIFNYHVPLDNYSQYSTSNNLAKNIGLMVEKPISPYYGALSGVFCTTTLSLDELRNKFSHAVGHQVSLYKYGEESSNVAIVAGGGNISEDYEYLKRLGVNVLVTGVAVKNDYSEEAHNMAKKFGISILGGTHYSTEKFACMAMVNYFKKLGMDSEFLKDELCMEDL